MTDDDLVVLQHFTLLHEAELAATALRGGGIAATVREALTGVRREGGYSEGVTLLVALRDLSAARELLESEVAAVASDDEDDLGVCAECGSPLASATAECRVCNGLGVPSQARAPLFTKTQLAMMVVVAAAILAGYLYDGVDASTEVVVAGVVFIGGGLLVALVVAKLFRRPRM